VDALFTTHQEISQLWTADPWSAGHVFSFPSSRTPGYTAMADPSNLTAGTYTGFYRSLVAKPGVTTDDVVAGTASPTSVSSNRATFVPVSPARLLDTRVGNGLPGALAAGVPGTFQVAGRGGVPANAVGVTGNLTVTGQTGAGYLVVGPAPVSRPTTSTLNFPVGDNRANGVTVALGDGGTLSVTYASSAGRTTQAVFDVTGYFVK
jgi:hypothetical protein